VRPAAQWWCLLAAVVKEKIEFLRKHVDIIEGEPAVEATEAMDTT